MITISKILPPVTIGPVRRGLWLLGLIVLFLVVVEILLLFLLRSQVDRYKKFWQSKADQPGQIVYVALGDSAAQGIGATSPTRGYVGLVAKELQAKTGKEVQVINLSVSGAQVQDAITAQLPLLSNVEADVVTVEIGANDIRDFEPGKFRREFKEFISALPDGTYVADIPDFGGGPLLQKAEAASTIVRQELAEQPRLHFVPLERETKENFNHLLHYAADFFHPNNWGYKVWANAFIDTIDLNKKDPL